MNNINTTHTSGSQILQIKFRMSLQELNEIRVLIWSRCIFAFELASLPHITYTIITMALHTMPMGCYQRLNQHFSDPYCLATLPRWGYISENHHITNQLIRIHHIAPHTWFQYWQRTPYWRVAVGHMMSLKWCQHGNPWQVTWRHLDPIDQPSENMNGF